MKSPLLSASRVPLGLALLAVGLAVYVHSTVLYVAGHQRPWVIGWAFASPLGWALAYDIRWMDMRGSLIRATATIYLFVVAMMGAQPLRQVFLATTDEFRRYPEAVEFMGSDLSAMLANHTVGYWGCFLMCLALSRLFLYRSALAGVTLLVGAAQAANRCPLCNHERTASP